MKTDVRRNIFVNNYYCEDDRVEVKGPLRVLLQMAFPLYGKNQFIITIINFIIIVIRFFHIDFFLPCTVYCQTNFMNERRVVTDVIHETVICYCFVLFFVYY